MANNDKYLLTIDGNEYRFQEEQEVDDYKFNLEKLSYNKGIYRPAEMSVTMNVGGQNVQSDTLVNTFYMKDVKLAINDETVAEDYFVFSVKPVFQRISNVTGVKLELTIYSRDKLLTLDKYSKAWAGRKLGEDVFKEVENFSIDLKTSINLQVVDYSTGEFIQPYLVQYNESFYDFLRRTTNRCGEFLYHENGQLNLGMEMNDMTNDSDPDYADIACKRYYENILREGVETTDYAYNYVDGHSDPKSKPYSNPLTYDDYLSNIGPTYTDFSAQMDFLSKNVMNSLCVALEGTSLSKIIANVAATEGFKAVHATTAAANLNFAYKNVNTNPWDGKTEQMSIDDKLRQFGTMSDQSPKSDFCGKKVNMNANFYSLIREAEKKVSENAVYLEFGQDTQKLCIGDKIKVNGVNYIIIGVNGSCELSQAEESATPNFDERQQVIGVMLYGDAAIPPALPDIAVRESQPQLAFVTDNFDPLQIGRVRVRFAWQPKGDDASPWIRVSLPFATDGAGVKFKPEVGDEVMVSFEEGNIERPYVSGFLLSPRSNNSWSYLPDRSITSKNGHNITFNDGLDGGNFFYGLFPALQLLRSFIPNFVIPRILEDNAGCMGLIGGMTISDRYGLYKIALSSDSRSVLIQSSMGDVTVNAFTGITLSAPNGDIKIQGKNVSIEASDTVTIESGKAVKERFLPEDDCYDENGTSWSTSLKRLAPDIGLNLLRAARTRLVDNVIDVSLMRSVTDIFMRPINGTTKIKSTTFVQIEAGKGSTEYPKAARKDGDSELILFDLHAAMNKVASTARSRVQAVQRAFAAVCRDIQAFNAISGENGVNASEAVITFNDIKNASYKENKDDLNFAWNQLDLEDIVKEDKALEEYQKKIEDAEKEKPDPSKDDYQKNGGQITYKQHLDKWNAKMAQLRSDYDSNLKRRNEKYAEKKRPIESVAKLLSSAINALYKASQVDFKSDVIDCGNSSFADSIKSTLSNMTFSKTITLNKTTTDDHDFDWAKLKKHHMRTAAYSFLSTNDVANQLNNDYLSISQPGGNTDNLDDDQNWGNLIDAMVSCPITTKRQKAKVMAKEWARETFADPAKDSTVNRKRWKVGVEGKILFSDNSEMTMTFDKDGQVRTTENVTLTDKACDEMRRRLRSIGANLKE